MGAAGGPPAVAVPRTGGSTGPVAPSPGTTGMLLAAIRADEDFDPAARTADAVADDTSPTDDAASSPLLTSPTFTM